MIICWLQWELAPYHPSVGKSLLLQGGLQRIPWTSHFWKFTPSFHFYLSAAYLEHRLHLKTCPTNASFPLYSSILARFPYGHCISSFFWVHSQNITFPFLLGIHCCAICILQLCCLMDIFVPYTVSLYDVEYFPLHFSLLPAILNPENHYLTSAEINV